MLLATLTLWIAADSTLLVLHKGHSSLGFYTPDGKLQKLVKLNQHPHEMVITPDRRFVYITENGTMRIENPGAGGNSVAIVDLKKRKLAGRVPTAKFRRPHGIDLDAKSGLLAVSTEAPDQLLLIDTSKRAIAKTFETKGRTSHMVTYSADAKWAFVSNSSSAGIGAVNLATGDVETIATGTRPEDSALSRDGRELYVCNREAAKISIIDTATRKLKGEISTGQGPVRIEVAPDGTLVYALMHDKAIGFADAKAKRELTRVPVEGSPVSLHLSSDGTLAYAASEAIDLVHIVDVAARRLNRSFRTPAGYAPDPVMSLP